MEYYTSAISNYITNFPDLPGTVVVIGEHHMIVHINAC